MDREKANLLYDLLEDLYYETDSENMLNKICDIQTMISREYLEVSDIWKLNRGVN